MLWFGPYWSSGITYDPAKEATPPTGMACKHCRVPFAPGDRGVILPFVDGDDLLAMVEPFPLHIACLLRDTLGPNYPIPPELRPMVKRSSGA